MEDIHKTIEQRNIKIENVGLNNITLPFCFKSINNYSTIANITSGVELSEKQKGAHLSRIVEVLNEYFANKILTIEDFTEIMYKLSKKIEADKVNLKLDFNAIIPSLSPVTNKEAFINTVVSLYVNLLENHVTKNISLKLDGAMCCPSSKKISKYGAHSQRCSLKTTILDCSDNTRIEDMTNVMQECFSAPVSSIVKREDEKYLTERAYENPKFSEDLIRDTLIKMKELYIDKEIIAEMENYESIHSHNVYAKGRLK